MGDKKSGISRAVNWRRKTIFDQDLITLIKPAVARPARGITRIRCRVLSVVVAHAAEAQGTVHDGHPRKEIPQPGNPSLLWVFTAIFYFILSEATFTIMPFKLDDETLG
jgi:hypothetical protein